MKYKIFILSVMCIIPCLAFGAAEVDIGGSVSTDTSDYTTENRVCGFETKGEVGDIAESLEACSNKLGKVGQFEHIKDNQWKETIDASKTIRIWTLDNLTCDDEGYELVNGLCKKPKPAKPAVAKRKPAPAKKDTTEQKANEELVKACKKIGGKLSADKKTCTFTYTAKAGTTKEEQTETIDTAKKSFVDEETYKCNDVEGTSKRTLTCQDKYKNTVKMVFEFPTDAKETKDWKEEFKNYCDTEYEYYDAGSELSDDGTHCTFLTSKTVDVADVVSMLHDRSTTLNEKFEHDDKDAECGEVEYKGKNTFSIECTDFDADVDFIISLKAIEFSCPENEIFDSEKGKCEKDDTGDSGDENDEAGTDSATTSSSCAEQVSADVECSIPGIAKPGCKIQKIPEDDEELIADMYDDYFDKDEDSALSKTKEYVISTYCYDDNDNFVASIEEDDNDSAQYSQNDNDDDDPFVVPETTDKEELKKALKKQARSIVNKHNKRFNVLNTKQS